jgi:type IV fimbrial biogenesis protein FimT
MRARRRGLTLIEVAITLAVLAVLGALALPNMAERLSRQRLQTTAETLAADLADARFEAARRGLPLHVQAQVQTQDGTAWCWAVATAPGCGCDQAQACQIHRVRAADHPGVRLLEGHALVLDPAGAGAAGTAAVFASPRGEQLRVDLTPMGRPRVCAQSGQWPRMSGC